MIHLVPDCGTPAENITLPVKLILIVFVCLFGCFHTPAGAANRAVSLRVLQERLVTSPPLHTTPDELKYLAGLKQVRGVVVDTAGHDLIIYGTTDLDGPELYTDDLIVAMRNAWGRYDSVVNNIRFIEHPGCSIDPDPEIVRKVAELWRNKGSTTNNGAKLKENWAALCTVPQRVAVFGVPRSSHYAKVVVNADYLLKDISNGNLKIDIPGFASHMDMLVEAVTDAVKARRQLPSFNPMNRYWFAARRNECSQAVSGFEITECEVKLLTETEYVNTVGKNISTGKVDSIADAFAGSFMSHYDQIARANPIYGELKNIYRFTLLAHLLHEGLLDERAHLDLSYLLDRCRVAKLPYDTSVSARCTSHELDLRVTEHTTASLMLLSFGGVSVDVTPESIARKPASDSLSAEWQTILRSRPKLKTYSWDYPPESRR